MPTLALAQPMTQRRLHLRNEHTGETFNGPYRDAAGPLPDAMADSARVLRDHHANKVGPVDVGTLDLLADIMEAVGQGKATVLSAFHTPGTNTKLASNGLGVAEHSQHLLGKALDLKRGGVEWYPRFFFLHIDTGPVRSWEMFGRDLNNLFAPRVRGRLRTVADRMRLHRAIVRRRLSAGH
jgi:uncharacterized protein YcbK (DUF882 family)